MMRRRWVQIVLGIVVLCGVTAFLLTRPNLDFPESRSTPTVLDLPSNVKNTYEQLSDEYGKSMGATIKFCRKEDSAGYVVSGSGGFTAESYAFDPSGTYISRSQSSDVPRGERKPWIFDGYECALILEFTGEYTKANTLRSSEEAQEWLPAADTTAQPPVKYAPTVQTSPLNSVVDETRNAWQSYRSLYYGIEVEYPPVWRVVSEGSDNGSGLVVAFGTKAFGNQGYDGEFFVVSFSVESKSVDAYIESMGSQFDDRVEHRTDIVLNGEPAKYVVVTTSSVPSWSYEAVIVPNGNHYFVIHNGATPNPLFEQFYRSFRL